jgi:glycosyltransferase involved in cell wall biosynthesis
MGVDVSSINRTTRAPDKGAVTIAYLGVASPERRLEVLVDMLAELRSGGMAARLLIIGDGNDRAERRILEERAQLLGVERHVEITGFLPRSQALELAGAADMCVSPIYPSPIFAVASPTKLIEYLALGVPVIANDHPEQRIVLRESRAGVCTPWGGRHFARAARWLMRHSDEERGAMGRRGRDWVETHRAYGRIADDVERVYLSTLARGTAGRSP